MNSLFRPTTSYRGQHNEFFTRLVARFLVLVVLWPSLFLPAIASSCATRTLGDGSVQSLSSQVLYDADNRPYQSIAPDGVKSRTVYNALGQVQSSIRAFGTQNERLTRYDYDVLGQRIQTTMPDGGTTTTRYDDDGRVIASFDRVDRGGMSQYDSLSRVVKSYQLRPAASANESLQARIITDGAGNALYSQTQYDDLGRAIASRDTQGRWSYTSYDDASNVIASKDPLGHVSSSVYDELNRAYQSTDAKGHTTTSSFDNVGRQYQTTFADGSTTSTTYDELNRAVGVTDQLGKTKTMHYDALGRMDYIEMPVASGQVLRTRFGFNELGEKAWQQDARGVQDDAAAGLNINSDAPQSRVTRFAYDVRGRLVQRIMPGQFNGNALAEAMQYNELGQLTRKRDFRGDWTSYQYDDRGRLLLKSPDAALNDTPVSFSYPDEFTTIAQRGLAKTVKHEDPTRGWTTGIETQALAPSGTGNTLSTFSYAYDAYGNMQSQTLQSGSGLNLSSRTTSFGYDGLDRLQSITSDDNQTWNYSYDEVGNKQSLTRPNGTTTNYAYDQLNRLTDMATRQGQNQNLVSRFDYHLRADGRRDGLSEQVVQPDGTTSTRTVAYAFDLANRLTGESGTDGQGKSYQKSYTLDAAGNRLASSFTLDGQLQAQTAYTYNSLDWLTGTSVQSGSGTSTTSYGYDANGAQISQTSASGTQASVWDFEGHLQAQGAVDGSGNWSGARTSYAYDASGMRLSQSAYNATGTLTGATSYVWDGDRVAEERDQSGVLQAVYEHGQELGPLRLRRFNANTNSWQQRLFVGDGQDSTRQLMNEAGAVTDSYFYDAFGNALNGGQGITNNAFRYTGQQLDSSGLYYLRARYYNAGTGRFLSQDPEMGSGGDPVSMHRYLYADADAVNGCDPTGRFDFSLGGIATAIFGTTSLSTIAANTAIGIGSGAIIGAGVGAGDAYFQGGTPQDVVNAEIQGAMQGAKFGAFASVSILRIPLLLWGAFQTGQGTGSALASKNYGLAAWRLGTFVALVGAAHAAEASPTGANVQAENIAENQVDLGQSEEMAENPDAADPEPEEPCLTECFIKGTLVLMAGGNHKPIEKIKVGDRVVSRDKKSGKTASRKVLRLFQHQAPATLVLHFKNGDKVETTKGHPFYVQGKGFVRAGELGIGTSIVTRAGPPSQLVKIEQRNSPTTVYNFEVEDFHTYFVTSSDLWVHNNCSWNLRVEDEQNHMGQTTTQEGTDCANPEEALKSALQRGRSALGDLKFARGIRNADYKLRGPVQHGVFWQFRFLPDSVEPPAGSNRMPHINLEKVDASTGHVISNWHYNWAPENAGGGFGVKGLQGYLQSLAK